MTQHDTEGGWKRWDQVSGEQLKQEIEQAFTERPGVHHALEVKVENPIREYRIPQPSG